MAMQPRTRLNAWDISLGSEQAAAEQEWHPVLTAYALGVQRMQAADTQAGLPTPESWLWAAHTHGYPPGTTKLSSSWWTCKHARGVR